MKTLRSLILVALVVFLSYRYQEQIGRAALSVAVLFSPAPCSEPIDYSLGSFSESFGMTQGRFLELASSSAAIWSDAHGRQLFRYSQEGDLKINLIYDYRQRATNKMQSLGLVIENEVSSYDALKAKYDSLISTHSAKERQIAELSARFEADKREYESLVAYWNSRGGAPKPQYEKLQQDKASLESDAAIINQAIASANSLVDSINSAVTLLNGLAKTLDLNVQSYNAIGSSTGPEFDGGEYIEDPSGKRIDIYQFSDETALLRVLAHEFGHALGMDHVVDRESIMYRLNQGKSTVPNAADLQELYRVCNS